MKRGEEQGFKFGNSYIYTQRCTSDTLLSRMYKCLKLSYTCDNYRILLNILLRHPSFQGRNTNLGLFFIAALRYTFCT